MVSSILSLMLLDELQYRRASVPAKIRASAMDAASQVGYDLFEEKFLWGRILKVRWVHADSVRSYFPMFLEPPCSFNPNEIVRVDWQTWATSKGFGGQFEASVVERVESIVVATETLLANEIFSYGLGPEYNWLHWEEGKTTGEALPIKVFYAIRELIEGDWQDSIAEHSEEDEMFLDSVHPRLRSAVKRAVRAGARL